jgi:hypothetical protein
VHVYSSNVTHSHGRTGVKDNVGRSYSENHRQRGPPWVSFELATKECVLAVEHPWASMDPGEGDGDGLWAVKI